MLPFLKPALFKNSMPEEAAAGEDAIIKKLVENTDIDKNERNIILAHQFFVSGHKEPELCESEQTPAIVGGLDAVDVSAFDDFEYAALGHIHGGQFVGSEKNRYSGTPIKFSVSERNHNKNIVMVDMEEKNKEKELILCSLLDAALHAEPHVENQAALKQKWERLKQQETDWESILSIADRHRVLPLLYDVLENILPEDGADWKRVQERSTQTVWQSYRLLFMSRYVTGLLKDAGIDTILLKGSGVAGLYPVPELRKSGDVDLLVENGKMAQEAGRCLQVHGFVAESGHQENHHLTYMSPEGIRLELHSALVEPFDSTEVNTFLEKCQKDFFENRVTENVMGVDFFLASPSYQAFYLLLHMLQHFLRSGFGLKLLCDWVVFWEHGCTAEEEAKFLTLVRECGILNFTCVVTLFCVRYLGLSENKVQFLEKAGEAGAMKEEAYLEEFFTEIMEAEEFGEADSKRMVAMRGTGWIDYIREFHHQMHLSHPKAGQYKILYPILWVRTFFGFVYRNRKLRGISSIAILKNAKKRSRLVTKMKLFQKNKYEE